jgi:putative transposase
MNPPKCDDEDYINFPVATPKTCSATEAAHVQPHQDDEAVRAYLAKPLYTLNPTA